MKALSLKQPWAYLIANGLKDIENRKWRTKMRGPVLIHASLTPDVWLPEYEKEYGIRLPCPASELPRGGIVGIMWLGDCVTAHPSKWFWGPIGFIVEKAKPLEFWPCKGMLNFFEVEYPKKIEG